MAIQLPDRPKMSDYKDYDAWVVDIMKFKKIKRDREKQEQQCPQLFDQPAPPPPYDPRVVSGPENLNEAVHRTQQLAQLGFSDNLLGSSSAQTFALPRLSGSAMEGENITTLLNTLGKSTPSSPQISSTSLLPEQFQDPSGTAQGLMPKLFSETLAVAENQTTDAFNYVSTNVHIVDTTTSGDNVILFMNDQGQIAKSFATIEVESCLSSGGINGVICP